MIDFYKILDELDAYENKFDEIDIFHKLAGFKKEEFLEQDAFYHQAETLAFGFYEGNDEESKFNKEWGTYFGPLIVQSVDDKTVNIYPHLKDITKEIINYWRDRLNKVKHPILKARYAGLLWDFSKPVTGEKPHIFVAHILIDAVIELSRNSSHVDKYNEVLKLKRALELAISIKDGERISKLKDAILDYEKNVEDIDAINIWSISYRVLIGNRRIKLTQDEEIGIIGRIEERLDRLVSLFPERPVGTFPVNLTALYLAKYYKKNGDEQKVKDTLKKYLIILYKQVEVGSPIQAQAWLMEAHEALKQFDFQDELKKILLKMQEVNKNVHKDMRQFSYSTHIDGKKLNNFIEEITADGLDISLKNLAFFWIPDKEKLTQDVKFLAKQSPIVYNSSRNICDHDGRIIAVIGSIKEDLAGHIVFYTKSIIDTIRPIARMIISKIFEKYSPTIAHLTSYLFSSPIFEDRQKPLIEAGIKAYLNGDAISSIHILIPQLEGAVRNLLSLNQGIVLKVKERRGGGFHLKIFDELLRDDTIIGSLTDNVVFYFQVIFTDPRGLNLRNDVCHGMKVPTDFSIEMADLVFCAFLLLAEIEAKSRV